MLELKRTLTSFKLTCATEMWFLIHSLCAYSDAPLTALSHTPVLTAAAQISSSASAKASAKLLSSQAGRFDAAEVRICFLLVFPTFCVPACTSDITSSNYMFDASDCRPHPARVAPQNPFRLPFSVVQAHTARKTRRHDRKGHRYGGEFSCTFSILLLAQFSHRVSRTPVY